MNLIRCILMSLLSFRLEEKTLADKDGNTTIENLSSTVEEENEEKEKEQARHRALACPPVVTHVTYRGLRKIRKMRRNQEVRLHSPISEGEEGHCEVNIGLSGSEDEQTDLNEANMGSLVVAHSPTEIHVVQPNLKPFLSSNSVSSDYQSYVLLDTSTVNSNTCSKAETEGMHSVLSALQTHTKAKINSLESDSIVTCKMLCANENGACRTPILEAGIIGEAHIHKLELSESVPLTIKSDLETCLHPQSLCNNAIMHHPSEETSDTPQMQPSISDTATNSNTHLANLNTASNLFGLNITPDSCQDSQLYHFGLDEWNHKENQATELSSIAGISGHAAWQTGFILEDEDTQQLYADGETLQLESKKIVDRILTNALVALERIDISERESDTLSREEFFEGMDNLIFMGANESMDEAASLGQALREHLPVQGDGNPQSTISDGNLGSRIQADGSRSTPSSGYESIAGSDTDIRSSLVISADITSTSGLFSMQELQEEAVSECYPDELELCMERGSASQNDGQDILHHSTLILGINHEEEEGPAKTETNNENLPPFVLSDGNITSVQSVTSETSCNVNKGQTQCVLGKCVCFSQQNNTELQYSAKDNPESNNHGQALHLNSGDVSTIIYAMELSQGIRKSSSQVGVSNPDSEQLAENNIAQDVVQNSSENEDRPNHLEVQSHAFVKTIEPRLISCESLNKPVLVSQDIKSGHTQGSLNSAGMGELSLVPDVASLACMIQHEPDSTLQGEGMVSASSLIWSLSSDTSADSINDPDCFRAVKVTVNDDQSQEDDGLKSPTGVSLDRAAGRLPVPTISARPHVDLPGTFAIISEEEETDTVFVNDTGPLLSPSTRRVKIYPFSLSPIYEEDSGREDTSRDDVLHVPPATEEEQRSEEQQASSILSLLQSVSERLQSSTFETEQDMEDRPDKPEYPQCFLRPLWDRYDDHDDDDAAIDGESSSLLHQQLTENALLSTEPQQKNSEAQDGDVEDKHCETTLSWTANTPFYQYLKSNVVPSFATETPECKSFSNGKSLTTSTLVSIFVLCVYFIYVLSV